MPCLRNTSFSLDCFRCQNRVTGFRKGFLLAAQGNKGNVNGGEVKGVLILALGIANTKEKKKRTKTQERQRRTEKDKEAEQMFRHGGNMGYCIATRKWTYIISH